ncbi:glycosyltransferase family 2 protein [uncultured Chryseobacterium sp.]|uniref:glycosyltransferase family 2 protein n=1 Tax=uncultured Chryseobacterium sp. TaxID=259322 RepID=UPI0025ED10B0|nr:glycosyltransferase family 2 protein [uncultured Chryseobacterium sp.]
MKISIITACYNREKTISTTIECVVNQNYNNIEYLIIDGNSKDSSINIINRYKSKVDYIISENDTGIYNAINKGIVKSTGDIIGLLHSDDFFYSNGTISQIANVFKETNADIVYANGMYVEESNVDKIKRIYKSKPFRSYYLYFGWTPLHTTIFVRKEVFEKYGLYREDFNIASDYEISLRWFRNKNLKKVFLDQWVVKMRLGGKSTDMKQQKLKSSEDLKIINQYNLLGHFTLFLKIFRKIPQYILPKLVKYK